MIFLSQVGGEPMNQSGSNLPVSAVKSDKKGVKDVIVLDDVDRILQGCSGTIERKRDPKMYVSDNNML